MKLVYKVIFAFSIMINSFIVLKWQYVYFRALDFSSRAEEITGISKEDFEIKYLDRDRCVLSNARGNSVDELFVSLCNHHDIVFWIQSTNDVGRCETGADASFRLYADGFSMRWLHSKTNQCHDIDIRYNNQCCFSDSDGCLGSLSVD